MISYNLKLVDLSLPKEGFRQFISSWILELNNKIYVIDPGPTASIPILVKELGEKKPDYFLLTHIHVDHAGGIGNLIGVYPQAKIIASELSHKHLIDPTKLIQASTQTLGDLMLLYGEIKPVPSEAILNTYPTEISIIKTPGHAPHHISFVIEDLLFCGEALGVICPTVTNYLRPATPIKFDFTAYKESINHLKIFNKHKFCFAHYGSIEADSSLYDQALKQVDLWVKVVNDMKGGSNESDKQIIQEQLIFNKLLELDPFLKDFNKLDLDIQAREKTFIGNSIKGLLANA